MSIVIVVKYILKYASFCAVFALLCSEREKERAALVEQAQVNEKRQPVNPVVLKLGRGGVTSLKDLQHCVGILGGIFAF